MECRRCAACGQAFRPRSQVQEQQYCGLPVCQRERRRRWQLNKRRSDQDYRQNQVLAQRAWGETHGDYWRRYRLTHPDYCERNRVLQRERDLRRRGGDLSSEATAQADLAKMDASGPIPPVSSGIYQIVPAEATDLAKMDALTVKITVLSKGSSERRNLAKEDVIGSRGPPC